jgi:hypothetical protein
MALLKFKRSAVPAKVPALNDIALGELAINTYDGKVYTKKDDGTPAIVEVGGISGGVITNTTIDSITNHVGADHIHYKVKATEILAKGNVVKVVGFNAGENAFEVAKVTSASDIAVGVVYQALANGEMGAIINTGLLEGINTSAFSIGTVLYPNTSGGFTSTKPTTGRYQALAFVVRSNANKGTILIEASEPQPTSLSQFTNDSGYITGITSANVTTALGYTPANISGPTFSNGITVNNGGNQVQIAFDGNLEIVRADGNGYIDFKNTVGEDYDSRIQQIGSGFAMTGTVSAGDEFRAPIFRDTPNTAYYVDPAGTSNLNNLTLNTGPVYRSDWTTRFQSGSDFVDGTLVTTDIPATGFAGESFLIEITGKSYSASNLPFKVVAQGYLYDNTIINYTGISYGGDFATYIKVFEEGGVLKFWWPRISYWNSFNVNVMAMDGPTNNTITRNRVTAIGNSTEPTGTKKQQINLTKTLKTGDAAGSISGFNNPTTAPTANTIVYRDGIGDIAAREIILSSGLSTATPTVLVSMFPSTNQMVRTTPTAVAAAIQGAASGTWNIRSADLNQARYANTDFNTLGATPEVFRAYSNYIPSGGSYNQPPNGAGDYKVIQWGGIEGIAGNWGGQIVQNFYDDRMWFRRSQGTTWQAWREFIHDGNYTNYAMPSGASATNSVDVRAPIFYDSPNTAYFIDPAGDSVLNTLYLRNGSGITTKAAYTSNFGYSSSYKTLVLGNEYLTTISMGVDVSGNASGSFNGQGEGREVLFRNNVGFITPNAANNSYLNVMQLTDGTANFTAYATAGGSFRAPLFYDTPDTSWFLDPSSTSVLNVVRANAIQHVNGTSAITLTDGSYLYLKSPDNGVRLYLGGADPANYYDNTTHYFRNRASTIQAELTNGDGFKVGPNSAGQYTRFGGNGGATDMCTLSASNGNLHIDAKAANNLYLSWYNTATTFVGGGIAATVFVDRDNSAYFINPTDSQSIRTVGDWRSDSGAWTGEFNGKIQYHANNWYFQAANQWEFRRSDSANAFSVSQAGVVIALGDMRAPIFYDSPNTGFFVDPSSTSNISGLTVGNRITGSISGDAQRLFNHTGANNDGLQFWNTVGNDTLNPNTGWHYALRLAHGDADTYYSATLAVDFFADNVYVRRKAGGTNQSWRRFALYDNVYQGAFYASSFIDADNTAFFLDPNNTGTSLNVAGSIVAAGNVTAYSDIRIKANVETIPSALNKIDQIRGVTYTRTDLDDKEQRYAGVIAQEIEAVLPEAVRDLGNIKAVDYNATIALLIEAVKELSLKVKTLEEKDN